jgi:hypothetical protein
MGERLDALTEALAELQLAERHIQTAKREIADYRRSLVTHSGMAGMPCAGELSLNSPEVATHDVAPPDDGEGFSMRDEPPSHPLPPAA